VRQTLWRSQWLQRDSATQPMQGLATFALSHHIAPVWVRSPTYDPSTSTHRRRVEGTQELPKVHYRAIGQIDQSRRCSVIRNQISNPIITHRMIFQSSLEAPGGGTAARPNCARPSVFTHVVLFSVYAAPGRQTSASDAPRSPWCP